MTSQAGNNEQLKGCLWYVLLYNIYLNSAFLDERNLIQVKRNSIFILIWILGRHSQLIQPIQLVRIEEWRGLQSTGFLHKGTYNLPIKSLFILFKHLLECSNTDRV